MGAFASLGEFESACGAPCARDSGLSSAGQRGQTGSDATNLRAARRPSTLASGGLRFEFRNPRLERGHVSLDFRLGEAWGDGLRAVPIVAHGFDEEEALDLAAQRG